jgi:PAS domain S-box-containing protein
LHEDQEMKTSEVAVPQSSPQGGSASIAECLSGGGEMGALIRTIDWSKTAVGPVTQWPQSLRTAVSILLDSRFPMYIAWGPAYTQFYNDGYRPILGSTKHPAAMGRAASETFAESWHIIGPMFDEVMSGKALGAEDWMLPLDRHGYLEECYFTFSYSPIRAERGVGGVHVTVTETTTRVLHERRLRTLRDLAAKAADAKSEPEAWRTAAQVLSTNDADLPFALLYANREGGPELVAATSLADAVIAAPAPRGCDMGGWSLESAFASRGSLSPLLIDDVERRFGRFVGPKWPEPVERALVLPIERSGSAAPYGALVVGISPRRDLDDSYRDFCGLVADRIATAVANTRAYAEERRRAEALTEIDRAKTTFFSNISHEFRTPLTLMLGPMEDALGTGGALVGDDLRSAYRNTLRLHKLVNALLDFSRIEAGRMQALYVPTDLAELTSELAGMFESAMSRASLRYTVRCSTLQGGIFIDRDMYEKVIMNLLSNALKFTLSGAVELTLADAGAEVELTVRDTGVGIAPEELPRLFERFHRIEGTRARTHEGSGIGLALVDDLVKLHGGSVSATSVLGEGTTFTVRLPKGSAHLPDDKIGAASEVRPSGGSIAYVEEALHWLGDEPTGEGSSRAVDTVPDVGATSGARLLVADDNADLRGYLVRLLATHWRVTAVADGEAALRAARQQPPDLILTDVMMPGLDGFGLLRALRDDERTSRIPVIMLSARAGDEARIEGLEAGADDYLTKPFGAREAVARVRTQLELSRLREEGRIQANRLRELFMQSPVAIAVVRGAQHRYELTNPRYREMTNRQDLDGRTMAEVWPEVVGTPLMRVFDDVFETGRPFIADEYKTALNRTGTVEDCFFKFNLLAMRDPDGTISGMMCTAVEITEQVRARQRAEALASELQASQRAVEAASRAKDEFLAILGHELRNPLAPILTAVHLMRQRGDGKLESERAVIERQTQHLVRLVDDMLDVSRITGGKVALQRTRVEASDFVVKGIELASPLMVRRAHQLVVDLPATGLVVDGDPQRLAQVVSNLLANAAKYTREGGRIEVRARREGDEVVIDVRDNGIGIAPEMQPHIFEIFVQERQALDRSSGGLGLGLTIVRSLVTLHGGFVVIRSEGRDRGTEVSVRLPACQPATLESTPALRQPSPSGGVARTAHRILVVEDNPDAASLLASALELMGHETRVAYDGPAALSDASEFAPEVALVDIGLPVMDGYEVGRRLRSDERLTGLKLVAITGYGQDSDRQRAQDAGFDAHIVKPVNIDVLADLISKIAAVRRKGPPATS